MSQIMLSSMHLDPLRNETSVNKNSMLHVVYWFMNNIVGSTNEAPINETTVYSREDSILIGWLFVLCGLSLLFILVIGVFCTLPSLANPKNTIPILVLCVIMVIPVFVIGVCHIKGVAMISHRP